MAEVSGDALAERSRRDDAGRGARAARADSGGGATCRGCAALLAAARSLRDPRRPGRAVEAAPASTTCRCWSAAIRTRRRASARRRTQPAAFEAEVREGYGAKADAILAAYRHATEAEGDPRRQAIAPRHRLRLAGLCVGPGSSRRTARARPTSIISTGRPSGTPTDRGNGQEVGLVFGNIGLPGRAPRRPPATARFRRRCRAIG